MCWETCNLMVFHFVIFCMLDAPDLIGKEMTKSAHVLGEGNRMSIQAAGADGTNNTGCYHTPQIS